jgi:hypothetical protein
MRRYFGHRKRPMPLIRRDGAFCEIITRTGEIRPADPKSWPKFGPYAIAEALPFPDER